MANKRDKFIIIDGHALIHRAYHAIPPSLTAKDGQVVNAVYGFTSIMLKALKDLKPDYIAVTFDLKGPTFRHKMYKEYKGTRAKPDDELISQFELVKDVVRAFDIQVFEMQGFEADDVIGTLCKDKQVDRKDMLSLIVTGDLDTLQLVDGNTEVFTLRKGMSDTVTYDIQAVKDRYDGLTPEQMIDHKALRGDTSDNIPGVRGIGEKTSIGLLKEFGTLERIYEVVEKDLPEAQVIKERIRNLLIEYKDDAMMSKELGTIKLDVPITFDIEECKVKDYNKDKVFKLFGELEFNSLLARLPELRIKDTTDTTEIIIESKKEVKKVSLKEKNGQGGLFDSTKVRKDYEKYENLDFANGIKNENERDESNRNVKYILVDNDKDFEGFLKKLKKQKVFAFDTETDGLDLFNAKLLGLSFCWEEDKAYYVTSNEKRLKLMKEIFEDENVKKVAQNMKFDATALLLNGIEMKNYYFDTMIASYLLHPGTRQHSLDALALKWFQHRMIPITDLIGTGKKQVSLAEIEIDRVSEYSGEDAFYTWLLYGKLENELKKEGLMKLFNEIEMPLVPVLIEMEVNGVKINDKYLKKLSVKAGKMIDELVKTIYKLAGGEFNVSSPMQLQEILFDKLEISSKGIKHTKKGFSTAASELEKLKGEHEIIDFISEYRELTKLKSTYLDALPKLINKKTGRIHTSFNQTITATGRLSSTKPNLQNIPIRTDIGREIRKAFVVEKGYKIVAADYSQVELRVIACLAKDEFMMEIFRRGEDIHSATAAKIFEVELDEVTKDMRRKAKEVNFGVLYGMGASGLAQRTGITKIEAAEFIKKYFESYKKVKEYKDEMVEEARQKGYVETLFGRKRALPEIHSSIHMVKAAAERMAVNMPIQGTAADLMKIAMIEVYKELKKVSPETKLLMQVHDELVFEVPEKEMEKVAKIVDEKMEKIHDLCVPIKVDTEVGDSWGEMDLVA